MTDGNEDMMIGYGSKSVNEKERKKETDASIMNKMLG
jgi:hypothetical protein